MTPTQRLWLRYLGWAAVAALSVTSGCEYAMRAPAGYQIQAHEACQRECDGKRAITCSPFDKACMKELRNCVYECERYYGYRSGGGG
jgi:hypothetical protein